MTKEKLVDYVMTTPNNPNLAVLNSLIDKHDKDILDKAGGAILDENGKLLNSVLPEGYPHEEEGYIAIFDGYPTADESGTLHMTLSEPLEIEFRANAGETYYITMRSAERLACTVSSFQSGYVSRLEGYTEEDGSGEFDLKFEFEGTASSSISGVDADTYIKIEKKGTVIAPLDPKFLPKMPTFIQFIEDENGYPILGSHTIDDATEYITSPDYMAIGVFNKNALGSYVAYQMIVETVDIDGTPTDGCIKIVTNIGTFFIDPENTHVEPDNV